MPFTSPAFLALLIATVPLYYLSTRARWQHTVLIVSSFLFYWFAGWRDLGLLLFVVLGNHVLASVGGRSSRARLVLAVVGNLGVLAYFKYRGFFAHVLLGAERGLDSSIPLGISFYVFQLVAYQVDLYRGKVEREESFLRLLLYVLFFPHHQAGPIMRPASFLPQFHGDKLLDWDAIGRGVSWTVYGLVLKVCADRVAVVIDPIYANGPQSMLDGWVAALGFGAQIYGDFAGYSSMAIGVGLLLGYQLDRNFNQPYLAHDPSQFWQRWHITLSQWLRDYLYVSLGGNRHGSARTYLNLLITMTLGGLWHGPSWNFVVWGLLHGLLLCVFRVVPIAEKRPLFGWIVCQFAVLLLWVPFRAPDLGSTLDVWSAMFGGEAAAGSGRGWLLLALGVATFFAVHGGEELMLGSAERRARFLARWQALHPAMRGIVLGVALLAATVILRDGTTFIYFRF